MLFYYRIFFVRCALLFRFEMMNSLAEVNLISSRCTCNTERMSPGDSRAHTKRQRFECVEMLNGCLIDVWHALINGHHGFAALALRCEREFMNV